MSVYLQPQPDDLVVRDSGEWARAKLDYLRRYMEIFEISMKDKWPERNYVDLQAGPGKNVIRETGEVLLGSPLIALSCQPPFTGYYFVEYDAECASALQKRCETSTNWNSVTIISGDCNVEVNTVVKHIKRNSPNSLNLAFLDPEGLELRWSTVVALASVKKMDMVINYPQMALARVMPVNFGSDADGAVDQYFGTRQWRDIFREHQEKGKVGLHRDLIDLYRSKLHELGYREVKRDDELGDEPLMRNARTSAPLYRLIFASKHPLGQDFWRKTTKRDAYGQAGLFS